MIDGFPAGVLWIKDGDFPSSYLRSLECNHPCGQRPATPGGSWHRQHPGSAAPRTHGSAKPTSSLPPDSRAVTLILCTCECCSAATCCLNGGSQQWSQWLMVADGGEWWVNDDDWWLMMVSWWWWMAINETTSHHHWPPFKSSLTIAVLNGASWWFKMISGAVRTMTPHMVAIHGRDEWSINMGSDVGQGSCERRTTNGQAWTQQLLIPSAHLLFCTPGNPMGSAWFCNDLFVPPWGSLFAPSWSVSFTKYVLYCFIFSLLHSASVSRFYLLDMAIRITLDSCESLAIPIYSHWS